MITFAAKLELLKRRLGMYLLTGTYGEVCAFIDGMDMISGHQIMVEFRSWLIARGVARPELAWWLLALGELYPGHQLPNPSEFTKAENDAAIARLFELLGNYLSERQSEIQD